jgi:hypothetical protein
MNEDPVRDILRTLADEDAAAEVSPRVEVRLRQEFRSWKRRRTIRRLGPWVLTAAAMVLVFTFANRRDTTPTVSEPAALPPTAAYTPQVARPAKPLDETTPRARRGAAAGTREPVEITTEFFPLMDPAPPFERGQLLRVELPAAAMRMVGLPVREEYLAQRIHADVLVGEEGLPRAIRFVKFERQ